MDFVRSNVLRRGPSRGQEVDVEQQHESERRDRPESDHARRFVLSRPQMPSLFTRERQRRGTTNRSEDESPKTARFQLNLPYLSTTRLHLPNLSRTGTRTDSDAASAQEGASRPSMGGEARPSLQRSRTERFPVVAEPLPTHTRARSDTGRRRFRSADPAEMHLADLAETGRARRRRQNSSRSEDSGAGKKPKRFLYCFPWIKSRRVRSQILRCLVSGLFLVLMLSVYLALSITKNINTSEFTILLILIILFTTIFFCHGLIRLCMLIVRKESPSDAERARLPDMHGPGGYAVPRRPIRVVLARDEEAAGLESETNKLQPPAYGLWRESVRVDPNRIYWQRNEQSPTPDADSGHRPTTANRPPSYASDDGVEYAVEARPRSMAPLSEVPLPVHPSEAGRVAQRPSF